MSEQVPLAQFAVRITSAENASWQGTVETENTVFQFESELQLLKRLLECYPALLLDPPSFTD